MNKIARNNIISVVFADDHELFRDGLRLMLSRQENINIVGEAANGKELVELAASLKPDVILTDIRMPYLDGIEATRKILEKHPDIGIISLSMFDDDNFVIEMLEVGAKGYLLKNASKDEIITAIETVYTGNVYYCNATSNKLSQMIQRSVFNPYKKRETVTFTPKELQVIALICTGLNTKEIAEKLFLSVRTIEGFKAKIEIKMEVNNSVGIVIYAIKNGIAKI